jgi:hypothetical protein
VFPGRYGLDFYIFRRKPVFTVKSQSYFTTVGLPPARLGSKPLEEHDQRLKGLEYFELYLLVAFRRHCKLPKFVCHILLQGSRSRV